MKHMTQRMRIWLCLNVEVLRFVWIAPTTALKVNLNQVTKGI